MPLAMPLRYLLAALLLVPLVGLPAARAQDLNVYLAASSDALGAGDAIDYTLMVSNTGSTVLNNVVVEVRLPQQIASFSESDVIGEGLECPSISCDPDETVMWEVGTLAPGDNEHFIYPTRIADSPPSGDATTTVVASADNISDIILTHVVKIDPSPLMRLSVMPDPGPAVPEEPFTYTLTYGNVGASNPTAVELTMTVPVGTSFLSATEGGTEAGDVVTWDLGTVGVGAGGRVEMRVVPNAGLATGATLEAEATLDSGVETELVVSSEALTEVGPRETLRLAYAISQNAVSPAGTFTYTLTATNTNTGGDITGVVVEVRLPQQIASFSESDVIGEGLECPSISCDPDETVMWEVGTLAPEQSRTIIMPTDIKDDAKQGEVLRMLYRAEADELNEQTGGVDLVVDPSPVTSLRLISGPAPAEPGDSLVYTLLASNVGSQVTDLTLKMTLPEGTTFVSATEGGTASGREVTWTASEVVVEAVGRVQVKAAVNASLPVGSILKATAELDTGSDTEYIVHASAVTPVRSGVPLRITFTSDRDTLDLGDPIKFEMEVENSGPADLTAVVVEVRLPQQIASFSESDVIGEGLECPSISCDPDETVMWEVGTLAPEQSRTIIMPTDIKDDADLGTFLVSPVVATATGSNEVILYNDVLLGEKVKVIEFDNGGDTEAPAAPTGLTAAAGETQIELAWTANTESDLKEYWLYRSTQSEAEPTNKVATIAAGTVEYTDTDVEAGQTYFYRLKAVNQSDEESDYSDEVSVRIGAPQAPTALTAEADGQQATLKWTANTEPDLKEYRLYRGTSSEPTDQIATITAGTVMYVDTNLPEGTFYYRLTAVDQSENESDYSNEVVVTITATAVGDEVPEAFALAQNYPNPFNPATTIAYDVAAPSEVRIMVYDLLGKEVAVLVDEYHVAGRYKVDFEASSLASGVYLYTLRAGGFTQTRRFVLLK